MKEGLKKAVSQILQKIFPASRKFSVIRQMSAVECGAACLSMILNYYGYRISLLECRNAMQIGRDGVSALAIAQAARKFKLKVEAFSIQTDDLSTIPLPAILHWQFNHFVVLKKASSKEMEIADPAIGRYSVSREEFNEKFTGVALTFTPTSEFSVSRNKRIYNVYHYFYKYISQYSALALQVFVASILILLFGLAFPFFTKFVVDSILPLDSIGLLTIFALGIAGLLGAQIISNYLRASVLIYLQARIDAEMMTDVFRHLLSLPLVFFQQRSNGDLLMRLASSSTIRETLTSQTLSIILDGTLVVAYFLIILLHSPVLGLIVLLLGAVQIAIIVYNFNKTETLMQADIAAQSASQSYLVECLSRIEFLKANGKESFVGNEWTALLLKQLKASYDRNHLSILIDTASASLRSFAPFILLWIGAYLVLTQNMSLGTMLALNAFAISFLNPLSSFVGSIQRLQLVRTYLERLDDIMETEAEQKAAALSPPPLTGDLKVEGVSFRYTPESPYTLKNISFSVSRGQKIAIVGQTGSGKSTLLKLLLGLYPLTEGKILYNNDVSLDEVNYQQLRRQIGTVLQEPKLFGGSIRKNVCFGVPGVSFEEIVEACRVAAIHDEIESMPMGYETIVSEENSGLSGGQCQRIALARALLTKPNLIYLDEATSHLDILTESIVDENLNKMSCTRIVVAHRLSTVINADLIIVLDNGEIIEQGNHEELIALGGRYAKLVSGL